MLFVSEIARDEVLEYPGYEVIGGIISPVHDSYRKPDLVTGHHRCAMVKISLQTSDWIRLSDWECNEQTDWTRTRYSLQYHQVSFDETYLNSLTMGKALRRSPISFSELHKFNFKRRSNESTDSRLGTSKYSQVQRRKDSNQTSMRC